MTKRNSNPDPPSERPDPPPGPPKRGVSLLVSVLKDFKILDEMRAAEIRGEIFKGYLKAYCEREKITEKELMIRIKKILKGQK